MYGLSGLEDGIEIPGLAPILPEAEFTSLGGSSEPNICGTGTTFIDCLSVD